MAMSSDRTLISGVLAHIPVKFVYGTKTFQTFTDNNGAFAFYGLPTKGMPIGKLVVQRYPGRCGRVPAPALVTIPQPLVIVNRELDRGLAMAEAAPSRNSPLFTKAEKAFSTATALVPRIVGLSEGDRLRIEKTVKELRSRLAQVAQYANVRSFPASVAC